MHNQAEKSHANNERAWYTPEQLQEIYYKYGNQQTGAENIQRDFGSSIEKCIGSIVRNNTDTEEAAQITLIKIFYNIQSFSGRSRLSTWIIRCAVNEALVVLRKRKSQNTIELDEVFENGTAREQEDTSALNPEKVSLQIELGKTLMELINKLPKSVRYTFILHYIEERSLDEIAEITGYTILAIKMRLSRARNILREKLSNIGIAPEAYANKVLSFPRRRI